MYVNVDLLALAANANYFSTLAATNGSVPAISLLVYDQSFVTGVLGPNATASKVAELPWQAFHEAGIYHRADNSMYIASNYVSLANPVNITVVSLDDYSVRSTHFPDLAVANGGTTYFPPGSDAFAGSGPSGNSSSYGEGAPVPPAPPLQVWTDEGTFQTPSQLVAVDPGTNESKPLITSYLGGHNFSSINDVRQHPWTGDLWFTDADYGYFQDFRPAPQIPKQVYRFEPGTGRVRVVADGFVQSNGIEFSPDLKTLYVTDTGENEFVSNNYTRPATIYAYDIGADNRTLIPGSRRVFAYADTGSPDGIHADSAGNVWAACGDGVHVWNRHGTLIGKVFIGEPSNNFAFLPDGLLVFSNYRLWRVGGLRVSGREVCKDFGRGCSRPDASANITGASW